MDKYYRKFRNVFTPLQIVVLSLVITVLFGAIASTVSAGGGYIRISGASLDTCNNTGWTATLRNVEFDFHPAEGDVIWYYTSKPDGTTQQNTSSLNNQTSPVATWGVGYSFGSVSYPYTTWVGYSIRNNRQTLGYITVEITCTGPNEGSAILIYNGFFTEVAPDNRVNFQHGDFEAVAYSVPDGNGGLYLDLYCWDPATGDSTRAFRVSQADVDATEPGGLIASASCGASLYRLISDEIQLNVVYGSETYIMVSDDLDFRDAEKTRIDE